MFERFTDRSRRVIILTREVTRESNAGVVGTEHLLLALLEENENAAATVLQQLGITQAAVLQQLPFVAPSISHPPTGHLRFTSELNRALERAPREALLLGHNYIAPDHLLLGLAKGQDSTLSTILEALGLNPDTFYRQVLAALQQLPGGLDQPEPPADDPRLSQPVGGTGYTIADTIRLLNQLLGDFGIKMRLLQALVEWRPSLGTTAPAIIDGYYHALGLPGRPLTLDTCTTQAVALHELVELLQRGQIFAELSAPENTITMFAHDCREQYRRRLLAQEDS